MVHAQDDSCPDYMLKAEECLRQEEERVANYLHVDSKPKLLKEVRRPRMHTACLLFLLQPTHDLLSFNVLSVRRTDHRRLPLQPMPGVTPFLCVVQRRVRSHASGDKP